MVFLQQRRNHGRRGARLLAAAVGAVGAVAAVSGPVMSSTARGATLTWVGGSGSNWNNGLNWAQLSVPINNDILNFSGVTFNSFNNIPNLSLGAINFNGSAGAYTLSGNGVTLSPVPLNTAIFSAADINNYSSANQTILMPITFGTGRHQITGSAADLTIAGTITQPGKGSVVQFAPATGNINLTGPGVPLSNGILGGWATVGQDYATLNGSGVVVPYTGYT